MAWTPISGTVPQYQTSTGALASGYYLKFYASGTSTAISMATGSGGGSTLDKCQLDSSGYPTTDGTTRFIPHIAQTYKIILYKNATDADNNTTGNADWVIDGIAQSAAAVAESQVSIENQLGSEASGSVFTLNDFSYALGVNQLLVYRNGNLQRLGSSFDYTETSSTSITTTATPLANDTYTFVKATSTTSISGDASTTTYTPAGSGAQATNVQAELRRYLGRYVQATDFGVLADDSTDNTTAINNAIAAVRDEGGVVELPEGLIRFSQLQITSNGGSAPILIKGKGMGVTILRSTLSGSHGDFAIEIGDATSNSGLITLTDLAVNGQNTTGEVGGVYIQNCQRYEQKNTGGVKVEYFQKGRGLRINNSWLCNHGKWFFIYCYKSAELEAVLSCTFDSLEAEQSGPVPSSAPPNWPAYGWTYNHSTIPDTDPAVDLINTGGIFSRVMVEASLAKNIIKLKESSTIASVYTESNYNWQDEGNEIQLSGYKPSILNGYVAVSSSATPPNSRYILDCGDSTSAFVRCYVINDVTNNPTNTRDGVNLNTSDRADINILQSQYEQGVTKLSEYQTYITKNLKRHTYDGKRSVCGMTEFELGRLLVQDYNAFDLSEALCERQEGTGGYPTRAKSFLLTNATPTGSIVEQHDAPFGNYVAAGIESDGTANTAYKDFSATTLNNNTYYMSTYLFNRTGSLNMLASVVDGTSTGSTLAMYSNIASGQKGWYRASRVQALSKADTETIRFQVAMSSLNDTMYFKGALLIDITQFDADYGTDLANYSIAELDRIISSEVLSSFSREVYMDAAPTTGSWAVGDKVYNSSPASAVAMGWMCTTAGSPGTWTAMANLA